MAARRNRVRSLDGIRGLGIGLDLLWHGFFSRLGALPNRPVVSSMMSLGRLSWSGVDLLFVLSGFLIGGILPGLLRYLGTIAYGLYLLHYGCIWATRDGSLH